MANDIVPQASDTIGDSPRRFSMRRLWRLSGWGAAAALALTVAAVASQTERGSQRLAQVLAAVDLRPVATAKIPQQSARDAEIDRLETQVRRLSADRDHLADRLASLERNFDDITGAIKRQAAPAAPPPAAPPLVASAPPAISPPATTEAKDTPAAEAAADKTAAREQAPTREAVPLPPARVAALPATEAPPPKPEFGVALASSSSIDLMRMQWAALKANFGPQLAGLRPFAAREQRGTVIRYRLVLGPLPNYAAAVQLCARLTAAHAPCHAGKYAGEPL